MLPIKVRSTSSDKFMDHISSAAISIFICLLMMGFIACENDIAAVNVHFKQNHSKKEIVKQVEVLYSDSAKLAVRILADELHRITEKGRVRSKFPKGVYVEFYTDGRISSWLKADKATRIQAENKIIARRNVVLYNVNRDTFRSEELIWDEGAGRIYTDRLFRFSNPNETVFGYKFSSNQEFTEYEFSKMSGTIIVQH